MKLSLALVASTLAVAAAAPAAAPAPEGDLFGGKVHFGHAFGVNAAEFNERDSVPVERAAPEGVHMARDFPPHLRGAKWFVDPVGRHAPHAVPCPDKARSRSGLAPSWFPGPLGSLLSRLGLNRPGRASPMGFERLGGHHGPGPVIIDLGAPEQLHSRPRPHRPDIVPVLEGGVVRILPVVNNAGGVQPAAPLLNDADTEHHHGHSVYHHHGHTHGHAGHHGVAVHHGYQGHYGGRHPEAHATLDAMLYKWDMFRTRLGKGLTDLPVPIRSFVIGALVGAVLQVLFSLIFLGIRLGCRGGSCRERRAARRAARQERRAARRAAKEARRASKSTKSARDEKAAEAGFTIDDEVLPSYAEGETDRLVNTA
ncbi:uncharacterized protein LOC62_06G008624 [Vanrija pseudolonga]|uniref:Uncharacterized protein n=1 Tax=Vanrija pseudolonga TaxID=143232 RepID=A0AAF1BP68_9TREE|nr:hypothetical protein LOC62_06G008624 [Vanrija pseudolonga]